MTFAKRACLQPRRGVDKVDGALSAAMPTIADFAAALNTCEDVAASVGDLVVVFDDARAAALQRLKEHAGPETTFLASSAPLLSFVKRSRRPVGGLVLLGEARPVGVRLLATRAPRLFLWTRSGLREARPRSLLASDVKRWLAGPVEELARGNQRLRAWRRPTPAGAGNDYTHLAAAAERWTEDEATLFVSVVVPVYNRRAILEKTLAGLTQQSYPRRLFEVIVADDGSDDAPEELLKTWSGELDIRIVRQEHRGYRLAAVRNLAIRSARGEVVASLDCDMLPEPAWLAGFMRWFHAGQDSLCVIGHRRYVSTDLLSAQAIRQDFGVVRSLPEVAAPDAVRARLAPSRDWRLGHFSATAQLRLHVAPYTLASGGNVAYRRADAFAAGLYDESFQCWGGEDTDFAYRLARRGAYFIPEARALAYHQDHPPSANRLEDRRDSRVLLGARVPYYRRGLDLDHVVAPLVSVYVPAYNAEATIERAVESALGQQGVDVEVCVCDDGSSDDTASVLERLAARDSRLRWMTQPRQGIAAASSAAIELARGEFLLQLDADDALLDGAVARLATFLRPRDRVSLVYAGYEAVDEKGAVLARHVPHPYDSSQHLVGNVVSHPRMFRARDYYRTAGFDRGLSSAVDYDLSLKLAERGRVVALAEVLYRYTVRAGSVSNRAREDQLRNHAAAIERAQARRAGLAARR